jgi:hypothetical protein
MGTLCAWAVLLRGKFVLCRWFRWFALKLALAEFFGRRTQCPHKEFKDFVACSDGWFAGFVDEVCSDNTVRTGDYLIEEWWSFRVCGGVG